MKKQLSLCLCVVAVCLMSVCAVGCGASGSRDKAPQNDTSFENLESVNTSSATETDIEYSLEKLSEAIVAWQNYSNYGLACELAFAYGDDSVWNFLNDNQKQWACDVQETVCCRSKSEAEQHLKQYLAEDANYALDDEVVLEYDGVFYCVLGAKGAIEVDAELKVSDIKRTAYNKLNVTTEMYGSGGELYCYERFDFEYIDGSYKIVDATDIELDDKNDKQDETDNKDDEPVSSRQPTEPTVDYSKFCGEYIEGDVDMGPCYSFVLKSVDLKTQKATFSVNYIGRNVSPIYSTDYVTATIDGNGKAQFSWEDNWENKGIGEFTLCDDGGLCVKLNMTVTESAESNRATLATDGVRTMYRSEE